MAPQAVIIIKQNKGPRLYFTYSIRKFTTDFTVDVTISASPEWNVSAYYPP
jgi:hypothetical protein